MLHENVNFQFPWKWIYVHDMRLLMSHSDAILSLLRFFFTFGSYENSYISACALIFQECVTHKKNGNSQSQHQ